MVLKVIDHELEELQSFKDLPQLFLRLEALAFETVEDTQALRQVVDHQVPVVVQDVREDVSLLVLVDQETLQLSCLLDQDAPKAPGEDLLVAKGEYADHVEQIEHLQVLVQLFVHILGCVV